MNTEENIDIPESVELGPEEIVQVPTVLYTVFDANGRIVRKGSCAANLLELQATNAGEVVMEGDLDNLVADDSHVRHTIVREYPSLGDQLDVLWKIIKLNSALITPEAQTMLDKIQAVKDAAPKDQLYRLDKDGTYVAVSNSTENN